MPFGKVFIYLIRFIIPSIFSRNDIRDGYVIWALF